MRRKFQVKFYEDESNIYDAFKAICRNLQLNESQVAKLAIADMVFKVAEQAKAAQAEDKDEDIV